MIALPRRHPLSTCIARALADRAHGVTASSPSARAAIVQWIRLGLLGALLGALAACSLVPRVVVKHEPIEVPTPVRTPLPPGLVTTREVREPEAACWKDTHRVFCNGQIEWMRLAYKRAFFQCNADAGAALEFDAAHNGTPP